MRGTVLVTGAGGFIGSHLARELATDGHVVRALDLRPRPESLDRPEIAYHRGDIRDRALIARLLAGVDVLHHVAGMHVEVDASEEEFRSVNVGAVDALLEEAARAGVRRVIHTSSVGIYGHVSDPPAQEGSPTAPETPSERTMLDGERRALERAAELGLDLVVLRPAWVYGPGCPRTEKLLRAVRKGHFFFVGGARNLRHPIFVGDVVDAYRRAARAADVAGGAFIIAGPRAVTVRELVHAFARAQGVSSPHLTVPRPLFWGLAVAAEAIARVTGREPPFSRRSATFFRNDSAFDVSAADEMLNFRALVDLDEGLALTVVTKKARTPTRSAPPTPPSLGGAGGANRAARSSTLTSRRSRAE